MPIDFAGISLMKLEIGLIAIQRKYYWYPSFPGCENILFRLVKKPMDYVNLKCNYNDFRN